jgi:hypothetical protein
MLLLLLLLLLRAAGVMRLRAAAENSLKKDCFLCATTADVQKCDLGHP